ncbi:hypothetical protein VTJ83DRAFT_5339 [Remersonia thermophila]|uniref:Cytochrome oxidase c assembly-domain-containing protein n=1 Tax=Remersonia thermophila TaxID=72144 RepID=A0ABR4D6J4_9PEZI
MRPALRLSAAPRTVSDATRFTANNLHAGSKAAAPPPGGRWAPPRSPPSSASKPAAGSSVVETPEQRVARLREAHRRAKEAQVSQLDRILDNSRRFFDSAHRITVLGLIALTGLAGVASMYTVYDMVRYNKKRKAEWIEAQKKLEADSLEAARLAYMLGKATDEQIALVEEHLERERGEGRGSSFFANLPPVLEPARSSSSSSTESVPSSSLPSSSTAAAAASSSHPTSVTETVSLPSSEHDPQQQQQDQQPGQKGLWAWLTSNLKREEEGDGPGDRRLGWESLSEEDDGAGVRDSDLARAVERREYLKAKAEAEAEAARKAAEQQQAEQGQKKSKSWLW